MEKTKRAHCSLEMQVSIYCKVLSIQALLAKIIKVIFLGEVGSHNSLDAFANLRLPGVEILLLKGQAPNGF